MFIDLGNSLLTIVKTTPDGMLIFFSSYALMNKVKILWENLLIMNKIEYHKKVYFEPKNSSELAKIREDYETKVNSGRGAVLIGVCRGKISEGLDFSDKAARCVVVVGIPFSQITDPRITYKRSDLSQKKRFGISHINGQEWYEQEAARATNQAIGRVIRHINDYGLILLVDQRFSDIKVKKYRSKWLRDIQTNFKDFEKAKDDITKFFEEMKKLNLPKKSSREFSPPAEYAKELEIQLQEKKESNFKIRKTEEIIQSFNVIEE
jgi:regulator of telomere elongation helicase 1